MKPHVRIYLRHFDIGEQGIVTCEVCGLEGRADGGGFSIHHIEYRSRCGKDVIENLMCLCMVPAGNGCHDKAHREELKESELTEIHLQFLRNERK